MKELEIKKELCDTEIITMQALEAMLDKLVLDQVKEQEDWKRNAKDIIYKNLVKIVNFRKKLEDKNKMSKKFRKINSEL